MFNINSYRHGNQIKIPSGIHHISQPITLTGENIRITGEKNTVLRGTLPLSRAAFCEHEEDIWCADVPCAVDAFYIGARKYAMARYPKASHPDEIFGGYAADCISPSKTREWADPFGGYIHAMHSALWGGYSYKITGKNEDGSLRLDGGHQNNRQMGMHKEYRFAENIREELSQEGEWYFDERNMRIYVKLCRGDDLDQAEIAVSDGFFILESCKNVTIENITFERSRRTFMNTKEPLLRSDWTIYRGGALLIKNSSHCRIDRCVFNDVGSNGVFVDGNNQGVTVERSRLNAIGGSGICFVGRPDSVRNPLFEYHERQSLNDIDKGKGPKSDNYPRNCTVDNCLIENIGTTEKQATGVEISMAYGITVRNCTICHTPRAGINISEGTFGGHRIEGCDVFDTVRETGDHGSFNSWGRDRYWMLEDLDDAEAHKYALLDMLAPNVITRCRFRCDKGWDIDLDDGSSNYIITENLCLHGGIKLREGFYRTVKNNVIVNNTVHFHVWYPHSEDVVENNIVFRPYAPIRMPKSWGKSIDKNVLFSPAQITPVPAQELMRLSGQDGLSVLLDPLFKEPLACNFLPTHPKLEGFDAFPTEFGVRYEPLKQYADVPVITIDKEKFSVSGHPIISFGALTVKNIEDDGEMSVYGTSGHNGALILSVEGGTEMACRGFLVGDVIVGWGDAEIHNVDELLHCTLDNVEKICVIRNQTKIIL